MEFGGSASDTQSLRLYGRCETGKAWIVPEAHQKGQGGKGRQSRADEHPTFIGPRERRRKNDFAGDHTAGGGGPSRREESLWEITFSGEKNHETWDTYRWSWKKERKGSPAMRVPRGRTGRQPPGEIEMMSRKTT